MFCQLWHEEQKWPGIPVYYGEGKVCYWKNTVTPQTVFNTYIARSPHVHAPFVKFILRSRRDVDVHAFDEDALGSAADRGLTDVARVLLDAGADLHFDKGYTPLEAAVRRGHVDTLRLFLKRGADVDQVLSVAACVGNADDVRILIEAGAMLGEGSGRKSTSNKSAW